MASAILIYITIDQQIKANKSIQDQFKRQERAKFEETNIKLDTLTEKIKFFRLEIL